jgi:uncharacterized phiE125 gp8 family phage protein
MMRDLFFIEEPNAAALDLESARRHLSIDGQDFDPQIEELIESATGGIDGRDGWLGRAIITQKWGLRYSEIPNTLKIKIPLPPLQSIDLVYYTDSSGAAVIVDPDDFDVDADIEPGEIRFKKSPSEFVEKSAKDFTIEFTAGYGDTAADVPERIKQYLRICVADFFLNREKTVVGASINAAPDHIIHMLESFRVRGVL